MHYAAKLIIQAAVQKYIAIIPHDDLQNTLSFAIIAWIS